MYEELGAAIFSGVAVMVLTIPINTVVAKMSRKYQLEQMSNKDKRTKLMNEIIGGVKVSCPFDLLFLSKVKFDWSSKVFRPGMLKNKVS